MQSSIFKILLFTTIALGFRVEARTLIFQSASDKFDLVLNGSSGTVNGKPADLNSIQDLLPLITNPLGNTCPDLKGRPDVTVKDGSSTRSFYVKQGLVSDGTNCLNIAGDGLFYVPLHRDFLVGNKHDSLKIKSPMKIFRQGTKVFEIRKGSDTWSSANPDQLLNWDFIERFQNSLKDFDVRLRVQSGIAEGKPKMIMQSGDATYEFYKVTNVMWAVKRPGINWLEASDDWSFWYDFEPSQYEDRYAGDIREAQRSDLSKEIRMGILDKLERTWSSNLRDLYHKLLLNPNEDSDLQEVALRRLKRKPSKETSGVMVQFLEQSTHDDLKDDAGVILKVFYPKGPKYSSKLSPGERAKALDFWRNWWNRVRDKN